MTTHELNALNSRLKDAVNDCLLLTEQANRCGLGNIHNFMCPYIPLMGPPPHHITLSRHMKPADVLTNAFMTNCPTCGGEHHLRRDHAAFLRLLFLLAQVLSQLVGVIVRDLGALHKLLDAFALLDLLAGFATFAATAESTYYVRPQLAETGTCSVAG